MRRRGVARPSAVPIGKPLLEGLLVASAFLVLAHMPGLDGWIVAGVAMAAAFLVPAAALPLCVVASVVQDAPALGPVPALATVVGCGTAHAVRGGWRAIADAPRAMRTCLAACVAAVLVGSLVSLAGVLGLGFEQSESRSPLMVALGDLAMPLLGAAIGAAAARDSRASGRLAGAALAGMAIIAIRVAFQVHWGPLAGFSEAGREAIGAAAQLSGEAADGSIRYVGSALTPNAMSMSIAFAALLAWPMLRRGGFVVGAVVGGAVVAAAVLAGSKSSLIVALAVLAAFLFTLAPRRTLALVAVAALGAFAWAAWTGGAVVGDFASRLRLDAVVSASSVRAKAWDACARELHASDAVLGMGLSHWPVFFERTIGERMADPHTAVYSYPWTYGIAGPVALAVAAWALARVAFRGGAMRAPAIVLLATLLLRDLVAIPLLVGTTVLTLQLWACIALVLARDER